VVVRLADRQYLVDPVPAVHVRTAMTVNDAASLTSAGLLAIPFVPHYHKLKLHAVRILRGGESLDRTTSLAVRFLQREAGLEQGIYSGEVTASILVSDLRVGDTIEYAYTRIGQNPVFDGKFVDAVHWDQGHPTLHRRVAISHPADRGISWRLIGQNRTKTLTPAESKQDGMRKLVLEERSIPKINLEPSTPPEYDAFRWLQLSEFPRWDDVAGWADALFRYNGELNEELREVVARLRTMATAEERVAGALEFVQSEIRYFSVSLGESSHRPTRPEVVLKQRYGDCKDKSLLLLTLLAALGIEVKPVLLEAGSQRRLDEVLPSPLIFNHAIVQVSVGGRVFYLDPTRLAQHGKLSQMGQAHENAHVLVVTPRGGQLATIASPNIRHLSHNDVQETVSLPKFEGDAQLKVRQVWHGVAAEIMRLYYARMPRDQIIKAAGNAVEQRYPGARLLGEPNIQDDRRDNAITVTASYAVPKLATEREGYWIVRYALSNMKGALAGPPAATRASPLLLPAFPYDARYTFEAKLPEAVRVVTDPQAKSVRNKHFTYTVAASFRGNVFKTSIELRTLLGQVEVADLKAYGDDLRAAGNIPTGVILVPKSAIKPVRSAKARRDLAQTLRDRAQETIDKTTQTIKSGKLTGQDLAAAHCLRAASHGTLGATAAALADADVAVNLSTTSLACRANIHFEAGEFDKSAADYAKAIALGATDMRSFHLRAISRFYAGKLEAAADDLARAVESDDKEQQVYSGLWLSWTQQRLGKPLPDAVLLRAKAEPRGDWPRPALAVMAGALTPKEMLELIERKTGDDRTMALSEGYFYLGQYHLGRGDKAKAREFFQRARDQNVMIYLEHAAAGFELRRLDAEAARNSSLMPSGDGPAPRDHAADTPSPGAKPRQAKRKTSADGPTKDAGAWATDVWKRQ
jgi:lipoprotein NlpI/transglutaminase-like putative cysteine protease